MKILLTATTLLALTSFSHAETCTGPVKIDVVTSDQELYPKGYKLFSVGECVFEDPKLQKQILRTCPIGSRCRVEGAYAGDAAIETITSVTRIDPYRQGMRDYREGLCFRARPYYEQEADQALWITGYHDEEKRIAKKYRHHRYVDGMRGCPGKYVK
jgi:hypothetical protein